MGLKNSLKEFLLAVGWRFPMAKCLSSTQPIILVYHGIPSQAGVDFLDKKSFERQILFLKAHFEFIHPRELSERRSRRDKVQVLLTFDDSFRNNAEVVCPILSENSVPAIFFACSLHAKPGRYLWFRYLHAMEQSFKGEGFSFRGEFMDMSPEVRRATIRRLREWLVDLKPHPEAMYRAIDDELPAIEEVLTGTELSDAYSGMTEEQILKVAENPLFSFGVHTVDHPFLSKCENEEIHRQILENKIWLEALTHQDCKDIAFPLGDYDERVLEVCSKVGIERGFAVEPVYGTNANLELPRMGIYSHSLNVLGFKTMWGNLMRELKIKIG